MKHCKKSKSYKVTVISGLKSSVKV